MSEVALITCESQTLFSIFATVFERLEGLIGEILCTDEDEEPFTS
jgi:hypothetical protein